jgi:uncharacterized protein YggE
MKTKHRLSNRVVVAALASAVLASGFAFTSGLTTPAIAQEAAMRTLTVTGRGESSVQTTRAQVVLGVEVQGREAEAVQQEVAQKSAAVVDLLQSRNVENLETTGVQLNPRYNYNDGRSEVVGFVGSNTVSFEMPIETVGVLLDDVVSAGANQIRNVSFMAEDEVLEAARQEALTAATADARTQANTVLGALNLSAQEIVSIQIDGANPPMPIPLPQRAEAASLQSDATTPVIGGEQTVNARVTLQIRY